MLVSKESRSVYEFGPFRLDASERLLLRGGQPVQLAPKVLDTLTALVENSGRLVDKDQLISILWPDTFVEEGTLARNISDLRKALGESTGAQKFIPAMRSISLPRVAATSFIKADDSVLIRVTFSSPQQESSTGSKTSPTISQSG